MSYLYSNYSDSSNFERLHLLDYILLLLGIIIVVSPFFAGYSSQIAVNQTVQKERHFKELFKSLDSYFVDSNSIPSARVYPKSLCTGQPNEVDFEYTLRNHLTGKVKEIINHAYIKDQDFPLDPYGEYSYTATERKTPLRNCEQVFGIQSTKSQIYDNNYKSCNYKRDSKDTKFRNCYLYATDEKSFKYQLAFYDEDKDKYIIYSKYLDEPTIRKEALR
jgi:hypothetical protein